MSLALMEGGGFDFGGRREVLFLEVDGVSMYVRLSGCVLVRSEGVNRSMVRGICSSE